MGMRLELDVHKHREVARTRHMGKSWLMEEDGFQLEERKERRT